MTFMPTVEYKWPQTLLVAVIGGFAAWCITILLNALINYVSPVHIPLWSTTILALMFVTYWFTGSDEKRIESILSRKPTIAASAEDPYFSIDDPRRNIAQEFYTLRAAAKWMRVKKGNGALNGW